MVSGNRNKFVIINSQKTDRMSHIEIIVENNHKQKKSNNKGNHQTKNTTPPKIEYKGITLKQYFNLCQEANHMEQIQEQSLRDSQYSKVQTPAFGYQENQPQHDRKHKIKTQVEEPDNNQIIFNHNHKKNKNTFYPVVGQKFSNTVDKQLDTTNEKNHKPQKHLKMERKRVVSIPSQSCKDFLNQSTLSSFYQLEKKKKKMLNKLKVEKQRANEMKLSDAFFVTKYGSKFMVNHKKNK